MKTNKEPIILFFDIETMPNLVRTWRKWEQNVIWYERYSYIWSISWSYAGEKKVYHRNITDFPLYKKDKFSDKQLVEFIWDLVDTSDVCIAHNGNAFDLKLITGRFVHHRLKPPSPYIKIDTKLLYKKYLNEDSNSLKDICLKHNLPHKLETGGEKLWELCEKGDRPSIRKMVNYNNGDIISLKAAYYFILPYVENHPNIGLLIDGRTRRCRNCMKTNFQQRGYGINSKTRYHRIMCTSCGAWDKGENVNEK